MADLVKEKAMLFLSRKWMLGGGEHISLSLNNKSPQGGLEFQ